MCRPVFKVQKEKNERRTINIKGFLWRMISEQKNVSLHNAKLIGWNIIYCLGFNKIFAIEIFKMYLLRIATVIKLTYIL